MAAGGGTDRNLPPPKSQIPNPKSESGFPSPGGVVVLGVVAVFAVLWVDHFSAPITSASWLSSPGSTGRRRVIAATRSPYHSRRIGAISP